MRAQLRRVASAREKAIQHTLALGCALAAAKPRVVRTMVVGSKTKSSSCQGLRCAPPRSSGSPRLSQEISADLDLTRSVRSDDSRLPPGCDGESTIAACRLTRGVEAAMLRAECGPHFCLVTPGIRPATASKDDQQRVMTPAAAVAAGADYLVIGRPVTQSKDPAATLAAINREIGTGKAA